MRECPFFVKRCVFSHRRREIVINNWKDIYVSAIQQEIRVEEIEVILL